MKIWKKYSQYLLSGEWHIHTDYTDGTNSIDEYCQRAIELGIPLVAFTEHVRRNLSYDFTAFLEDIDKARENYDVIILSGCEAKALPDGTLDVDDTVIENVDYPVFAFHSFPKDLEKYLTALYTIVKNPFVNTWAHPGVFLKKSGLDLPKDDLSCIFKRLEENEILIEQNKKYNTPSDVWIKGAEAYQISFVRGSDCHCIDEMESGTCKW